MESNGKPHDKSNGVLGNGAELAGKYNLKMVERALRNRWPITDEMRARLVEQMDTIIGAQTTERNKIAAGRVMALLDGINARREYNDKPAPPGVTINGDITITSTVERVDRAFSRLEASLPKPEGNLHPNGGGESIHPGE